jgi:hypothetical protein
MFFTICSTIAGGLEKTTGHGVIPIAILKEESNVEIFYFVFSSYYLES